MMSKNNTLYKLPEPAYNENNIPIVFSTDENYAPYLSVCIKSLIDTSSTNNNYDIWILDGGLTNRGQQSILKLIENNANISIQFFNIEKLKELKDFDFYTSNHASIANYYRLFIPKIFCNYKKIIYLDCDLLINRDIAELYNINLEDKVLGVVEDACTYFAPEFWARYCIDTLKFSNPHLYFNSGVLICDVEKMIEKNVTEEALKRLKDFNPKCWDQCLLNSALENQVKYLDMRWNFQWHWLLPEFNSTNPPEFVKKDFFNKYTKTSNESYITHYTSHIKAWNRWHAPMAKKWWEYAKKLENYSEILEKSYRETKTEANLTDRNEIKTSIIVPVYNVAAYLPKCLDSLVNQTLKEIEIICVDDESTDGSKEILERYSNQDSRIVYLEQKNRGQGSARNRGLEVARGKYIQFLDSDDSYELDCCETMYNIMENNSDVDAAYYGVNVIYKAFFHFKSGDDSYFAMKFPGQHDISPAMSLLIDINCWSKTFRKSFLDANNLKFPEDMQYEDIVFYWYWITKAKTIYGEQKPLVNYVRRKGSFYHNHFDRKSKYTNDGIKAMQLVYDYLNDNNLLEDFGEYFLKYFMKTLSWRTYSIPDTNIEGRQALINATSELIAKFDTTNMDLNPEELALYNSIKEKKYYALKSAVSNDCDNIEPFFDNNNIPIVFAVDNNYVSCLSVAIQSIIENRSKNANYDIVILYTNLHDYEKRMLLNLIENIDNVSIRFINMDSWINEYNLYSLMRINHITISAYFRLLAASIFKNYKKIIYLDCDIVTECDIQELYNLDIGDKSLGACKDTVIANNLDYCFIKNGFKDYLKDTLGINDVSKYFNSGVLVINIGKWINEEIENTLYYFAKINNKFFHDQNVLNAVFKDDYFELPPEWNLQYHIKFQWPKYEYFIPDSLVKLYDDITAKPKLIHYTSSSKPWNHTAYHTYTSNWWKYARKSPFYEKILIAMNSEKIDKYKNEMNWYRADLRGMIQEIGMKDKNKFNYYRAKILSFLTFGKKQKHYKSKRYQLKQHLKNVKNILKG